jgi:hypothetical protein
MKRIVLFLTLLLFTAGCDRSPKEIIEKTYERPADWFLRPLGLKGKLEGKG